jgi:predicted  nucleic acid-binding Zn-ribbon protein
MAWYLNTYECSKCGHTWDDEWSCCCDDDCPECGASDFSPLESKDLSVYVEKDGSGNFSIFYSSPDAANSPEYKILASVSDRNLAKMLEDIAIKITWQA